MDTNTRVYTISEITRNIKSILENQLPKLWIEGEISNLRLYPSGHTYFTLKDEFSEMKAVLFKNRRLYLNTPAELKDGLHIFAFGKISVYEKRGDYQIIIDKWEPKGIGALQLAFEELKKKLQEEGLFDEAHKKTIPMLPQVVGVITSPAGAAIRDIINVIERRFSNINIIIYPVRVQGEGSAQEISIALDEMNTISDLDVIIVGRGGGSLEDLWAFNEESVARSIFKSKIPIISAVGHEIDYTISDFVADRRAATPSVAAELVVGKKTEFKDKISFLTHKLKTALTSYIQQLRIRIDRARTSYVFKEPENTLRQYAQRLDELTNRLTLKFKHLYEIKTHKLNAQKSRLQTLNPKAILQRGYSITTSLQTGKIITQPNVLKKDDEVETQVAKGRFRSVVKR